MRKTPATYVWLTIVLVIIIWAVTNISSTVSSPKDGRSISTGLLSQTSDYLSKNAPPGINDSLDRIKLGTIPPFQEWLLSSFYGDALNYMNMSLGNNSYEPYSLRPLYPFLVKLLSSPVKWVFGEEKYHRNQLQFHSIIFITLNITCFLVSIIVGATILVRLGLEPLSSLAISLFSFLQLGYLKTLYAPMV
mgnify:CR=1 FL=1